MTVNKACVRQKVINLFVLLNMSTSNTSIDLEMTDEELQEFLDNLDLESQSKKSEPFTAVHLSQPVKKKKRLRKDLMMIGMIFVSMTFFGGVLAFCLNQISRTQAGILNVLTRIEFELKQLNKSKEMPDIERLNPPNHQEEIIEPLFEQNINQPVLS